MARAGLGRFAVLCAAGISTFLARSAQRRSPLLLVFLRVAVVLNSLPGDGGSV